MSGLSTWQPNSEIQDMVLTVTKSEKIKNSWKRSSCVFNRVSQRDVREMSGRITFHYIEYMRITFHYIAIHPKKKKKTFFSCTLKYNFNWTTAEQVEIGHHQWNGVLKMYRCMLWHLSVPDHWYSIPIKFFQFLTCRNPPAPPPKRALIHVFT